MAYIDAHAADQDPFYLSVHYTAPHAPWTGHPQDIVDSYDGCAFESCPQEELHPWAKVPKGRPPRGEQRAERQTWETGSPSRDTLPRSPPSDLDVGRILDKLEEKGCATTPWSCLPPTTATPVVITVLGQGQRHVPGEHVRELDQGAVPGHASGGDPGGGPCSRRWSPSTISCPPCSNTSGCHCPTPISPAPRFLAALKDERASGREQVCVYRRVRLLPDDPGPRSGSYVHRYSDHPNELWDLVNDPDERSNLIDDPAQAGRVRELRSRMKAWFARYVEPDKDGLAYNISGAGQVRPVGRSGRTGPTRSILPSPSRR